MHNFQLYVYVPIDGLFCFSFWNEFLPCLLYMKWGGNICVKMRPSLALCKITIYLGCGEKVVTNKKEMSKAGMEWVLTKKRKKKKKVCSEHKGVEDEVSSSWNYSKRLGGGWGPKWGVNVSKMVEGFLGRDTETEDDQLHSLKRAQGDWDRMCVQRCERREDEIMKLLWI